MDLKNEINEAYKLIAAIPVSGDSVEIMAAAREHLRGAFRLADPRQEESEENDG